MSFLKIHIVTALGARALQLGFRARFICSWFGHTCTCIAIENLDSWLVSVWLLYMLNCIMLTWWLMFMHDELYDWMRWIIWASMMICMIVFYVRVKTIIWYNGILLWDYYCWVVSAWCREIDLDWKVMLIEWYHDHTHYVNALLDGTNDGLVGDEECDLFMSQVFG